MCVYLCVCTYTRASNLRVYKYMYKIKATYCPLIHIPMITAGNHHIILIFQESFIYINIIFTIFKVTLWDCLLVTLVQVIKLKFRRSQSLASHIEPRIVLMISIISNNKSFKREMLYELWNKKISYAYNKWSHFN